MNKLTLIAISMTITLLMSLCATAATVNEAPKISGKRQFMFGWGETNPFAWHKYQFTKADLDRDNCNKSQGYYWCQAKIKCLRVAVEKCKLTSSGEWYDGTATEEQLAERAKAKKAATTAATTTVQKSQSGMITNLQGSTTIKNINKYGAFGKLQPPKHVGKKPTPQVTWQKIRTAIVQNQ